MADYSQADHLLIQKKIHQDLNRPKRVVQEAQVGQEVLEAHVLTRLEDPKKYKSQLRQLFMEIQRCNFKILNWAVCAATFF
jgi:hypothetical protein